MGGWGGRREGTAKPQHGDTAFLVERVAGEGERGAEGLDRRDRRVKVWVRFKAGTAGTEQRLSSARRHSCPRPLGGCAGLQLRLGGTFCATQFGGKYFGYGGVEQTWDCVWGIVKTIRRAAVV